MLYYTYSTSYKYKTMKAWVCNSHLIFNAVHDMNVNVPLRQKLLLHVVLVWTCRQRVWVKWEMLFLPLTIQTCPFPFVLFCFVAFISVSFLSFVLTPYHVCEEYACAKPSIKTRGTTYSSPQVFLLSSCLLFPLGRLQTLWQTLQMTNNNNNSHHTPLWTKNEPTI